ncbi:hypothetical protein B0F90DRAFT_1792174, partial [Multifurca ochricompacta]
MKRRLAASPELIEKIVPQFAICCRRLTPGPGYLEALCTENVRAGATNGHLSDIIYCTGIEL